MADPDLDLDLEKKSDPEKNPDPKHWLSTKLAELAKSLHKISIKVRKDAKKLAVVHEAF